MISNLAVADAIRTRALTLAVVDVTGTFSATSTGYARASGSFLTDGFEVGQEIIGVGWTAPADNAPKLITAVDALTITTAGFTGSVGSRTLSGTSGTAVEAAASRTLQCVLPADVEWENGDVAPGAGVPWWREEYSMSPGGSRVGLGSSAMLSYTIDYFITLFLPSKVGRRAADRYGDALLALFAPGQVVALTGSDLRVRGDSAAPWVGRFVQSVDPTPGFLVVPVTVPLTLWTANSI